ncbi:hypothetical protein CK203_112339 [Vitis vinifera]|uniref:Uncharacterized protein n=1 Tax=Vitis vinifera TaxID=29760 RepID=A0A438D0X1_VITVI|nr:hypothetical protein CK203_112339 [Vitis vinifera]
MRGGLRAADHVIRGLIRDPRGKFRPNWSKPYFIRELTPEGAEWLMDLDGNRFSELTNMDQLKRYYVSDHGRRMGGHHFDVTSLHVGFEQIFTPLCTLCFTIILIFAFDSSSSFHPLFEAYSDPFQHSFPSFMSPYHPSLRYVPCLKTTLRLWDQMSSSIALTWTAVDLDYWDRTFDDG